MSFETGLLVAVVLAVAVGLPLARWRTDARIDADVLRLMERRERRRGRGHAKIRSVESTGRTIDRRPEVRIVLELDLPDRVYTWTMTRPVDALDAPQLQPTARVEVHYDPDDLDNMACELDPGFVPAGPPAEAAAGSPTGATIEAPLWSFGHHDADAWLVPPRAAAPPVIVIAFGDPHRDERAADEATLVELAQHVVAEALWMTTDAPARAAALVDLERKRLAAPMGELATYDHLEPYLRHLAPRPIAVWGAARRDLAADGITIKIRLPDRPDERTLTATLTELPEFLIGWLVGEGLCRRIEPPAWYRAPAGEALARYASVLRDLQQQILADDKNRALAPLTGATQQGFVERAIDAALAHDLAVIDLAALTTAHYAARAGCLGERQRGLALALLDRHTGDHPVHLLSPSLLASLGRLDEAEAAIAARRGPDGGAFRTNADPYQRWLDRVGAWLSGTG